MSQTTTAINACDCTIDLDNASGVVTDISGSSNSISMKFSKEIGVRRHFKDRWPIRLECGKDASWTLNVTYTTATSEAFELLKNWYFATAPGARTCTVYLPNKNVGADKYSGEFRLESLDWNAEAGKGDPIAVTAVLVPSGDVTLTTNAT